LGPLDGTLLDVRLRRHDRCALLARTAGWVPRVGVAGHSNRSPRPTTAIVAARDRSRWNPPNAVRPPPDRWVVAGPEVATDDARSRRCPGRSVDVDGLAAAVPAAVAAHDVGLLHRAAAGAQAARGHLERPVGRPAAAALGLGGLLLGNCHRWSLARRLQGLRVATGRDVQ